jgi:DNA-directed RNA polymerase subunit RPC12/RpoP
MKCPKCGSKRIKRSQSRGFKEQLQKLFNQKPYRCIDCGWRGILKTKSARTKRDVKKYILIKIIIIIIIIIAIYLIISHLDREEPTPDQQSAIIYTKTFIA